MVIIALENLTMWKYDIMYFNYELVQNLEAT